MPRPLDMTPRALSPGWLTPLALVTALGACDAGRSSVEENDTGMAGTEGSDTASGSETSTSDGETTTDPLPDEGCTPGPLEESGTLAGRYGALHVHAAGQEYFLQVNEWNSSAPQDMSYGGDHFFRMTTQEASVPTNGGPSGYPSMFIGANSSNSTEGSGLPIQVDAIQSIPTAWTWDDAGTLADGDTNSFNAAYDVWFSTGPGGDPNDYGPSGAFLMVWLHDPADAQPIGGSPGYTDATVDGIPGTWDIWGGFNGGRPIISYVATSTVKSMSFDLNHFIRDAVENRPGTLTDELYLSNVFIGFEIWRGGVGLETTSFCAEVN